MWFTIPPSPTALRAGRALRSSLETRGRPVIPAAIARRWDSELRRWAVLAHVIVAARRRDVPVALGWAHRLPVLRLGEGPYRQWFHGTVSSHDRAATLLLGQDKLMMRARLGELGVPLAPGEAVHSLAGARRAARRLGVPLVLKRIDASNGVGVVPGLRDLRALAAAFRHLRRTAPVGPLLLERFVAGRHYRLLMLDDRCLRVAEGRPLVVVGDGRRSIRELLPPAWSERILAEPWLRARLRDWLLPHGLSIDGVPARGARIPVSPPSGRWRDRTPDVHPTIRRMMEGVARQLAPGVLGIDLICGDIARPLVPGRAAIVDVNPGPGTWFHEAPVEVADAIVSRLFPGPSRIPIVCVVGSNAAATVRGMRRNGGDGDSGTDVRGALGDVGTRLAFIPLEPRDVERSGIPFDRCRAVIVTSPVPPAVLRSILVTLPPGGRVAVHPSVSLPPAIRGLVRRRGLDVVLGHAARRRGVRPIRHPVVGAGRVTIRRA
jgi:D-alanine-D-alanine ligase-like ATP-grasp enzyme